MVEICPTIYSAAMEPGASCVRPPHDCAAGSALVLKCVDETTSSLPFGCNLWNRFPLLGFFKGVGFWGSNNAIGLFRLKFVGVY